jgi:hypothetical protein
MARRRLIASIVDALQHFLPHIGGDARFIRPRFDEIQSVPESDAVGEQEPCFPVVRDEHIAAMDRQRAGASRRGHNRPTATALLTNDWSEVPGIGHRDQHLGSELNVTRENSYS